ncbi:hypothetical protein DFH09DRAFT_1292559 [Mycena vulgaris]|nr:hypothetical protein DFH09DRAFT_1292559 [Mycena vulgaris]
MLKDAGKTREKHISQNGYEHREGEECEVGQRIRGVIGPRTVHTACHGADAKGDRLRSELSAEEGCPAENGLATRSGEVLTHTLYIDDLGDFKCGHAPGGEGHMRHLDATQHGEGPQAAGKRPSAQRESHKRQKCDAARKKRQCRRARDFDMIGGLRTYISALDQKESRIKYREPASQVRTARRWRERKGENPTLARVKTFSLQVDVFSQSSNVPHFPI